MIMNKNNIVFTSKNYRQLYTARSAPIPKGYVTLLEVHMTLY